MHMPLRPRKIACLLASVTVLALCEKESKQAFFRKCLTVSLSFV